MEFELNRVDYNVVGVTHAKCMKVLPASSENAPQKIAVGDDDGVLHVYTVRGGEIQTVFKTVSESGISRVELGGALGSSRDKIFMSCGSEIKGFTRKGKQFLGFDTNLTEPIKSMHVEGNDLLVCGHHSFYHYRDCKDANYFLCGDIINDVIALNSLKTNRLTPVLACEDRVLRVLDQSAVINSIPIESSPTVLHLYDNDGGINGDQVLYGTRSGGVGLLKLTRNDVINEWLIPPDGKKDGVTCLDCYDINGNGLNDIIIGRADGLIEVYSMGNTDEPPKQVYSYVCNETVTAVQGGTVGRSGFREIIAVTFSGWVFGLTTETTGKNLALTSESGHFSISQEVRQKIQRLREEVAELEDRSAREREKYQSVIQDSESSISAIPLIAINEKFYLNKDDASYNLCLEVQTSIDNVLIQSDVPVDLLDIEKNSAVVSFSDCNPAVLTLCTHLVPIVSMNCCGPQYYYGTDIGDNFLILLVYQRDHTKFMLSVRTNEGNFLLATYRCQMNTTRLDLKIRTIEGQYGTLQVYITPNIQPKSCQLRQYRIKPLSLHIRCHEFDSSRPYNSLKLKGAFSLAEVHSWIEFCLPEVPEKLPPNDSAELIFKSSFIGTILKCSYSKGEAKFESDNVSTVSILKDVISKEASRINKNRNLEITWDINEASVRNTLSLLHPKLQHQLELLRKISILQSVSELDLSNNPSENTSLLTDEYLSIIKNEKGIIEEYKQQPAYLDRLYGIITDLYLDKHKFQGVNVKNKASTLLELLEKDRYSFEELVQFFNS